jgi:NAD(P)H-dependent flavin oxidoreductase YrpB (nitropropane dioxygenase family)
MGCHYLTPEQIDVGTAAIRKLTNRPFALNFLLFDFEEDAFASALTLRPGVIAFAWPAPAQDLKPYVERAHGAGCKVTFMAGGVPEAVRAAKAGADVIIAQGTEGGGHVGRQTTMTLVPMIVDAVAPIPVLAAGGIADGRGLAAAIMLGADGVLLGTRFLASRESSLHPNFKQSILDSDGHDTLLSEIPDVAAGARLARRDVTLATQPLHRKVGRTRMGIASAPSGGKGGIASGAQERRRRRSGLVDGAGCRSHSRHRAGCGDRHPHRRTSRTHID